MANEKRLIDANALLERLRFKRKNSEYGLYRGLESAISQCNKAPTVDAVEVVHGRWILTHGEDGLYYDCSICGHCAGRGRKSNYCPNCGADMRGETE